MNNIKEQSFRVLTHHAKWPRGRYVWYRGEGHADQHYQEVTNRHVRQKDVGRYLKKHLHDGNQRRFAFMLEDIVHLWALL